ncbi:MAG: HesA/MoeB/ThiF family protein [Desulfuromonadales bacterium]|nr:HesA/MoeB/ThiF family protein [Desulfuromonadales bacterium]
MEGRYARQLVHWGEERQEKIAGASVLVAGVGGLGATVSQLLVRAGIGRLYLVDDGIVDWPDLNRQLLYGEADIGRPKLQLSAERLSAINSTTDIVPLEGRIDDAFRMPDGLNAVADCLDNYHGRFQLDALTPEGVYLVHGGLQGDHGQVLTLLSGRSQRLADIFAGAAPPAGSIPVTPDSVVIIAGLMTNELFATLFGQPKLLDRCLVICLLDFHISFLQV